MNKIIIFDLDGTIADTGVTVLRLINKIRINMQMGTIDFNYIKKYLSQGGISLIEAGLGKNIDSEIYLNHFRNLYLIDKLENEILYPGFLNYINEKKEKNIDLAICTNKPHKLANKVLAHHNIIKYFNIIVTAEDVNLKKPSPEGLEKIIKYHKYNKKEVLFLGDSQVDQLAAISAGIKFGFHRNGYDDGVDESKVDLKFDCYNELLERGL